jgi:hypothetical protein
MAIGLVQIDDSDELYRRIPAAYFKPDGRISSHAFKYKKQPDDHISVDIAKLLSGPQDALLALAENRRASFGVGSMLAGFPRSLGSTVRHAPLEGNHAHALVEGRNTDELCYRLAEEIAKSILIRLAIT